VIDEAAEYGIDREKLETERFTDPLQIMAHRRQEARALRFAEWRRHRTLADDTPAAIECELDFLAQRYADGRLIPDEKTNL